MTSQTRNCVLVAVDYGHLCTVAVRQCLQLARSTGVTELHFVHVAKGSENSEAQRDSQRNALQQWLEAHLAAEGGAPEGVRLSAHLVHGTPAGSIVQLASDLAADLVIVGTHGRKGMERLIVGSVAEAVVRDCGCPVLVARTKEHHNAVPSIEPPCPRCVAAREESHGEQLWCEQHQEKHGRRHTYYNTRTASWVSKRMMP